MKRYIVFGGPDLQASRWGDCSDEDFELQARFPDEEVLERKPNDKMDGGELAGVTLEHYLAKVF